MKITIKQHFRWSLKFWSLLSDHFTGFSPCTHCLEKFYLVILAPFRSVFFSTTVSKFFFVRLASFKDRTSLEKAELPTSQTSPPTGLPAHSVKPAWAARAVRPAGGERAHAGIWLMTAERQCCLLWRDHAKMAKSCQMWNFLTNLFKVTYKYFITIMPSKIDYSQCWYRSNTMLIFTVNLFQLSLAWNDIHIE